MDSDPAGLPHRISPIHVLCVACLALCSLCESFAQTDSENQSGRQIHVGSDVPTIAAAIKLAQPGDTIHLQPIVYRDYAGFYGKKGEPGKPITLDGHGATLEGSDPLQTSDWTEVRPGLFMHDHWPLKMNAAILQRWFFIWDGVMNHMGRTSKGILAPFKNPEDLQPGEWTWKPSDANPASNSGELTGTFYLQLKPGQKLEDARIAAPMRSAGVQFSGNNAYLIIKNLTATHPYNDGFNIHGDCREIVFENIRAIECGDDGISAHESAQYRVEGLVSIANSTGITDTVRAQTHYRNVFLAHNLARDLYFLNNGEYRVENAVVLSTAQKLLVLSAQKDEHTNLTLKNVWIYCPGKTGEIHVLQNTRLDASELVLENVSLLGKGESHFETSLLNGEPLGSGGGSKDHQKHTLLERVVPSEYREPFSSR